MRTDAVERRTTLLLLRLRIHLATQSRAGTRELLAEDGLVLAYTGSPDDPNWLGAEEAEQLLLAKPSANIPPDQQRQFASTGVAALDALRPSLDKLAEERAAAVLATHRRIRDSAKARGTPSARAQTPVDVLGVYIYLPGLRD